MAFYISAAKTYTEKPDLSMFKTHAHSSYEIFCFLEGDARYYVEGNIYDLSPGDILIINKAEAHSLLINNCIPYSRITMNFSPESIFGNKDEIMRILNAKPLGHFNRIHGTNEERQKWIYYLESIVTGDQNSQQIYLTVLINELCQKLEKRQQQPAPRTTNRIITHINQNLSSIQSLDELCERFFISKTHLNRQFKTLTGSTVWEYITAKRLLMAQELLNAGTPPIEACEMVGYTEYSTFYRAYKQRFGISPKNDYKK